MTLNMADLTEFILNNLHRLDGFRIFFPRNNPTFKNPEFPEAKLRVMILRLSPFPNIRESTTHHFLFQEVRRALPSAYIDFAFFPNPKNIPLFLDNKIPFFHGIQSLHSISDFDLVLISNSFTLEIFNLPYIFMNTGIPSMKKERLSQRKPVVIMGGSNALMAQCAISSDGDSYVDGIFFGEGEGAVERIVTLVNENKDRSKIELLGILEKEVRGIFDIRLPITEGISVSLPKPPLDSFLLTDYPILNSDIENTAKIQITQGCPCFCSFCFEGYTRKPFREYKAGDILDKALEIKIKHASTEFDFLSFNFNMHTGISRIIADLNEMAKFANFKSQRADIIAMRPELLDVEILSGKRNYTIGIEGISDRMRRFLHKSLNEKEILQSLEQIYARKPRQVKLFFILTGIENPSDRKEFKEFITKLKRIKGDLAPGCRTIMSFGLLVNLPFTPMQFAAPIKDPANIKQIKGDLKRDCETNTFEFRMAQDEEDFLISQHIALAGFECFEVISEFGEAGGYFDGENIAGDKKSLIQALRTKSADGLYEPKDKNYVFPFEALKGAPQKSFLFRMFEEARDFKDSGYCLEGKGECNGCGACEDRKLSRLPQVMPADISRLRKSIDKKKRPEIVQAVVTIKENGRFLTPEAKCAFIGSALLSHIPSLARDYLSCRQVQNMPASKGYGFLFGSFLYDFEFTAGKEIFIDHLKKSAIDSPIIVISEAGMKETGNSFRITSLWKEPSVYGFQNHFQSYLLENGMGFDIKKSGGLINFNVSAKDRKKKLLNSAVFRQENGRVTLEIETGSNFIIIDMLKYLFGEEWRGAMVESILRGMSY